MARNIEQARKYVAAAPLAVSGRGGHDTTFKVACNLIHGFELSDADALLLMNEYNERLDEPSTPAELRHKVDGASNSVSRRPIGYMLFKHEPYKRTPVAPPSRRMIWKITRKSATPTLPLVGPETCQQPVLTVVRKRGSEHDADEKDWQAAGEEAIATAALCEEESQ